MYHCTRRTKIFLTILTIKVVAISAFIISLNQSEKKIPYHQAIKKFDEYLQSKIEQKSIPVSEDELKKISKAGHIIIAGHENNLTNDQLSNIKRQLRKYLQFRFSDTYQKKSNKFTMNINFRLAKQAIKAQLIDYLEQAMNVKNTDYQKLLWHTVRSYVMHLMYEKSYFDEQCGGLVVDHKDIRKIFNQSIKLLKSFNAKLPSEAHKQNKSTKDNVDMIAIKKSFKHSHKKPISISDAEKFVDQIIERKNIQSTQTNNIKNQIMLKINKQAHGNTIDHYQMKKIAHDEIQQCELSSSKPSCKTCSKEATGANRKRFACGHTYHRTCLYKKYGIVEFLKNIKQSLKCPVCLKM